MKVYHNLKPIYNDNSKILILGSMPSVISRKENFYYANQNNRFWKIMGQLFNVKLNSNTEKELFLLSHNIALWDVIKSCDINGSSDSSIKNIAINDINKIIENSQINTIFLTGKKSYDIFNKYCHLNKEMNIIYLPSPSSANAVCSLESLIDSYKIILKFIGK